VSPPLRLYWDLFVEQLQQWVFGLRELV
jgi:hypothetical protein